MYSLNIKNSPSHFSPIVQQQDQGKFVSVLVPSLDQIVPVHQINLISSQDIPYHLKIFLSI